MDWKKSIKGALVVGAVTALGVGYAWNFIPEFYSLGMVSVGHILSASVFAMAGTYIVERLNI